MSVAVIIFCFSLVLFPLALLSQAVLRPNIVLLLSDDMGWAQPGFNGGTEVATPNMDRIANEGVKLTQFYVQPVCTATRGCLLTGRYAWKNGTEVRVGLRGRQGMLTDERAIADALRDAGYATWIVGKWHLGQWQRKHLPLQRGFDHHYGHYSGEIDAAFWIGIETGVQWSSPAIRPFSWPTRRSR